jgi:hypothetical protein
MCRSSGRERRKQRITRKKKNADRRGKRAADSRGGGEIRSGSGGGKRRSVAVLKSALGKQRWGSWLGYSRCSPGAFGSITSKPDCTPREGVGRVIQTTCLIRNEVAGCHYWKGQR